MGKFFRTFMLNTKPGNYHRNTGSATDKFLRNSNLPVPGNNAALFVLLVILFGVVRTLVSYSGFGYEDQVEQLPLIYRSFDSSYLQNDFFVNAALESAARTNYIRFIRLFSGSPENLPTLFFIFTLI
ncbi:MAG: hypothetical protein LC655_09405, partial [Bacteroidales bacterium]|nr:hypothetical protein [Bacteroidales bacterium]